MSVLAAVAGLSCALGQALGQGIVVADGGGHGQRSEFYTVEIFERMVKDARKGLRLTGPDLRAVVLGAIPLDEDERPAHFIKAKADAADGLVIPEGAGNDASLFGLIDAPARSGSGAEIRAATSAGGAARRPNVRSRTCGSGAGWWAAPARAARSWAKSPTPRSRTPCTRATS